MAREETPPTSTADTGNFEHVKESKDPLTVNGSEIEPQDLSKEEINSPSADVDLPSVTATTKPKHVLIPIRFLLPSSLSCENSFRSSSTISSLKEYLLSNWPSDWPTPPSSSSATGPFSAAARIKLLHHGRYLSDQETLKGRKFYIHYFWLY